MDFSKEIKKMLIDEEMNIIQLAEKLGTSQQNIGAKLKRNNPRLSEMKEISEALGYDIKIEFHKKE